MDYVLLIVVFIVILIFLARLNSLASQVRSMQRTISKLVEQSSMTGQPARKRERQVSQQEQPINEQEHPVNEELRLLIENGETVKAIKRAREIFGLSLFEGKAYVDRLKDGKY